MTEDVAFRRQVAATGLVDFRRPPVDALPVAVFFCDEIAGVPLYHLAWSGLARPLLALHDGMASLKSASLSVCFRAKSPRMRFPDIESESSVVLPEVQSARFRGGPNRHLLPASIISGCCGKND